MSAALHTLAVLWALPGTLVGAAYALFGLPFGARVARTRGAIAVLDHPLLRRGSALCFGHVVIYGRGARPGDRLGCGAAFEEHEYQHTLQAERLGPLYLPLHIVSGACGLCANRRWHGAANFLERGPLSNPPRPWA